MRKLVVSLFFGSLLTLSLVGHRAAGQSAPPSLTPPPPPSYHPPPVGTPPPPFQPTATPQPTLAPTVIVAPITSPTAVPLHVKISIARHSAAPKAKQTIKIHSVAHFNAIITVKFPNGDTKRADGIIKNSGVYAFSFKQPGSRITRKSNKAKVLVTVSNGAESARGSASYLIRYAAIDVSAQPRKRKRGLQEAIYVHARPASTAYVHLLRKGKSFRNVTLRTANSGWAYLAYDIPKRAPKGKVLVKATTRIGRKTYSGETSFTIK